MDFYLAGVIIACVAIVSGLTYDCFSRYCKMKTRTCELKVEEQKLKTEEARERRLEAEARAGIHQADDV